MIRNHKDILKSSNVKGDGINAKGFGIFSKFPIIPQFFPHIPIRLQVSVKCVILLFEMKKIPRILIRDYILLGPSTSTAPKASRRSDSITSAALSRYSISNQVFPSVKIRLLSRITKTNRHFCGKLSGIFVVNQAELLWRILGILPNALSIASMASFFCPYGRKCLPLGR